MQTMARTPNVLGVGSHTWGLSRSRAANTGWRLSLGGLGLPGLPGLPGLEGKALGAAAGSEPEDAENTTLARRVAEAPAGSVAGGPAEGAERGVRRKALFRRDIPTRLLGDGVGGWSVESREPRCSRKLDSRRDFRAACAGEGAVSVSESEKWPLAFRPRSATAVRNAENFW